MDLLANGKYSAECLILGVSAEEECTALTTAVEMSNITGGTVDAIFSDGFQELAELPLGECGKRADTSIIEGSTTITPNTGSLSVSLE